MNRSILNTSRFLLVACLALLASLGASAQRRSADVNGDGVVNIADVNAVVYSILSGDSGYEPEPATDYLSAKQYGAAGDGVTDDTEVLERLFNDAFEQKKAVFFDSGIYLICRSLTLRTGMEIYGEDATLKKKAAVTTTLAEDALKGQTFIVVQDASRFSVGDQFFIAESGGANLCTYGIITAIEGNRVSFTNIVSDQQPAFPGCVLNHAAGLKVSTSFALLRSWGPRFECDGVYIHDLTLDGNRTSTEAPEWANSCIHIDSSTPQGYVNSQTGIEYKTVQRNLMARNLVILNSPHDGISDQGLGGLIVRDCTISRCAMHGIHMGTRFNGALISNNVMTGNGTIGSGVFFCQDVENVIVEGNRINDFYHGCSDEEFGTCGKFIIIRNNEFNNIKNAVFDFLKATATKRGGGLLITGNTIKGLKNYIFNGQYLDQVILSDNQIRQVSTYMPPFVRIVKSNNVVITGNEMPDEVTVPRPVDTTDTNNVIDNSNTWN